MFSYPSNICWYLLLLTTVSINNQATTTAYKLSTIEKNVDIIDLIGNNNLKNAKLLRKGLVDHMKLIENMINILDEWAFDEITNITKSEKFNKENYNLYRSQIDYLQRNYSQLSEELPNVNTSDNAQLLKIRNLELKTELVSLKSNLDENTMKGLQLISAYQENDNIVNKYESLCSDIDILINKTIDKEQSIIANSCIEMIRNKNYEPADNLLNQITDYKKINYLVNKSYSSINFYTILNFSNHITNLPKRFYVLNELNNITRVNGHMTLNKVIALANSLSNKVINIPMFDNEITPKALDLMNILKTDIKSLTMLHLVDVFQDNEMIFKDCDIKLLTKIYSLDSQLVFDIFYEYYMHIDNNNNENLAQKFFDFFKILLKVKISDTKTLLHLIQSIQIFFVKIHLAEYADRIETLEILYDKDFPKVIKNILVAKKVGLVGYLDTNYGYLRSSSDLTNNTYIVYAYNDTNSFVSYEFWVLEKHHHYFKIRSYPFANYYLDTDNDGKVTLNKESYLNNDLWKLEIQNTNRTLIKNVGNNKYLYIPSNCGRALTKELSLQDISGFHWEITDLTSNTI